ncbi:hypothetical protein PQO03_08915 [Lentisphaera profundi]|uniref:Tetratricopeptide repeat protein n=1 Tax=Lentisphaera profundi TaxID=1658616 RepID=A0ABY7VNX1_9BACT|nr:hypothetical protein [Lentisphaera profundi]WDE95835.1 hypothetical protein PQO03_08915 [Lentisphaera profundi]
MSRIVLFIFLAINLYAEQPIKPSAKEQKTLELPKGTKTLLSSSNESLSQSIAKLLEINPYKVLENAVLMDDGPVIEALNNYQAPSIKVFSSDIYYRTLLITWLKENKVQAQENILQQNTWLLKKDSVEGVIEKIEALSKKNHAPLWNFRLNYCLSLLYEAKGDYKRSLKALIKANNKTTDNNLRYLLRRRMIVCSARTGNYKEYERFIQDIYQEESSEALMHYESLNDQLAINLLQGKDSSELVSQIIKHPNANLARSIQSLIFTGQHQEAYLLNPKKEFIFPFLIELDQFSLAKKLLHQTSEPDKIHYYQSVQGTIPKELKSLSKEMTQNQKLSKVAWLLSKHYYTQESYQFLYELCLNSKDLNHIYIAMANLTKSSSAADLYLFLSKRLDKQQALNYTCLLSYTKNPNSFLHYLISIHKNLKLQGKDLDDFVTICSTLALEINLPDAALSSLKVINDKNQNINHIIIASTALLRKKEFLSAAHNGLIRDEMKIPELMEIATYALNQTGDFEKAHKANLIAESFYISLAHLSKTAYFFKRLNQKDLLEQVYWRIHPQAITFNKDSMPLIDSASAHFLQKEDYTAWAKFAELKLSHALLQPTKIHTPAQALVIRKDLLRLQLIKAINSGREQDIIRFAKKWSDEFTMDIEPVIILHKYQLPHNIQVLQLKTDLFDDRWAKLEKHIKRYPKASIQLNEIAWLGASCFKRLDESSDFAKRAYSQSKLTAHLDTLAQCLYATGKINKAVELLQECVKLEPNVSYFSQKLTLWRNHLPAQE